MLTNYRITKKDRLVVLTGAGISAESGVRTFRDSNGLWEDHSIEEVATPEGFRANPQLVWDFYYARFRQLQEVKPNPGHYALVELEKSLGENFTLVTQNIDGLHQLAGSQNVLEMHGTIHSSYCSKCGKTVKTSELVRRKIADKTSDVTDLLSSEHVIDESWYKCSGCNNRYRPDIIWFGEIPYHLETIMNKVKSCTKFLVVGTSGIVYPAAQFLLMAKQYGAVTIGINLDPPENVTFIDEFHQTKSGKVLPFLVPQWLS